MSGKRARRGYCHGCMCDYKIESHTHTRSVGPPTSDNSGPRKRASQSAKHSCHDTVATTQLHTEANGAAWASRWIDASACACCCCCCSGCCFGRCLVLLLLVPLLLLLLLLSSCRAHQRVLHVEHTDMPARPSLAPSQQPASYLAPLH